MLKRLKNWFLEYLKSITDHFVLLLLRLISQHGLELTNKGKATQTELRKQRLRYLKSIEMILRRNQRDANR